MTGADILRRMMFPRSALKGYRLRDPVDRDPSPQEGTPMWYSGIDQHKRDCVIATYGPDAPRVKQARVPNTPLALAQYFAAFPAPHKAVVESTGARCCRPRRGAPPPRCQPLAPRPRL